MAHSDSDGREETGVAQESRRQFHALLDRFFSFYFRFNPVDATFIGIHDFDDTLPKRSIHDLEEAAATAFDLRREFLQLPRDGGLSPSQTVDGVLAPRYLAILAGELQGANVWSRNPALHTGEAVFSVIALFQRDAEPLADRVQAAIARMHGIPGFLRAARENASPAPADWTKRAAREARAAIAYFGNGVRLLSEDRRVDDPGFLAAADVARTAFEEHLVWLETDLISRPSEDYSCGREAFEGYLHSGHLLATSRGVTWIEEQGRESLEKATATLERLAAAIDPNRTWREQLASVANHHPPTETYYETYRRVWEDARQAAIDANLITWPDYPIDYVPVPRSDREASESLYYLHYRCPAPYGREELHRYLVTPVEPEMPAAEQERRLRAANYPTIKLNHVVHHGGLGHHVQNWHAFRAQSRIGRIAGVDGASRIAMFCAGTLVEGWACYATDLMEEIGALTPVESLVHAHGRLRMAARAVADVALHTGQMTLDQLAAFYEREAAMAPAAARAEAVKNSMFPGAAMMYLIGTDAIHDLRAEIQAREGSAFSLRSFHDRFLSCGAIPVSLIREAMLGRLGPGGGGTPDSAV
jgi:hypothetical protein